MATFNIHHGVGTDGRLDLARTAAAIAATGAAVVGLQEVDDAFGARSGFVDQAAWLGERLGMTPVFGATIDLPSTTPGAPRRRYGNAMLTPYPILSWHNTLLPKPAGEQRGLLVADLDIAGETVTVFTTHLDNHSPATRLVQAGAVADAARAVSGPLIVVGDLNARPGTAEVRLLTAAVPDTWPAAGRGRGDTFSSDRPRARIDYVLASGPGVAARMAVVVRSRASDHLPLGVDVEFAGQSGGG